LLFNLSETADSVCWLFHYYNFFENNSDRFYIFVLSYKNALLNYGEENKYSTDFRLIIKMDLEEILSSIEGIER